MTWWNDTGAQWGWAGCLMAAVMLLAFWAAVFAALKALFGMTRSQPCEDVEPSLGSRAASPSDRVDPGEVATTVPPRRC